MRHSAGAVIAAAAISGDARADSGVAAARPSAAASAVPLEQDVGMRPRIADEPKKTEEEKKKEEQRDPCPACGRG